jgi:hypothetical protein
VFIVESGRINGVKIIIGREIVIQIFYLLIGECMLLHLLGGEKILKYNIFKSAGCSEGVMQLLETSIVAIIH